MSRRFLYMVVENGSVKPLSYTLHRINPSRLFYPKDSPERAAAAAGAAGAWATTVEAVAAATAKKILMKTAEKARLPRPTMTFSSPNEYMHFALTGRNNDQIVAVALSGFRTGEEGCAVDRALLYDDASHSVVPLPGLTFPQRVAVPIVVGDDLYFVGVEDDDRRGCNDHGCGGGYDRVSRADHRVFVRGLNRELESYHQYPDWYWYSFPLPPYSGHAGETRKQNHHSDEVAAYAVVRQAGGWHIWASTRGHRTYSLYTENGEWSKVSDSPLPFRGPAVYAPEHGLWFGIPYDGQYLDEGLLGAWDLHAGADAPVEATGVWEVFSGPPYDRYTYNYNLRSQLVHLGDGGRFCVAKLFQMPKPPPASRCVRCYYESDPPWMGFVVLTGVEVERCDGGELRMVKHRSCKYSLGRCWA